MESVNRVAKNTLILYARMGITMFISLYVTRLVLATLGAEDFGIFNVVGGAISMFMFLNGAMTSASQRFMSFAQGAGDIANQVKIFNASTMIHLGIGFALIIVLEIAGWFLFDGILKIPEQRIGAAKFIYHVMVFSAFMKTISVPYDAVINAHENMLAVAVVGLIESLIKLGIAIYITYTLQDKLIIYGILMAALAVIILLIQRIYCHRKYKEVTINFRLHKDKALLKEMTNFAGWSFLTSTSSLVTMQGVSLTLNSFFGVILNTALGIANQLTAQLMVFSGTMLKALNPAIVKSEGSNNRDQMIKASNFGNKISFLLFAIMGVPFIIDMPFILGVWLKNVPEYAVIFCQLTLIRRIIGQLTITYPTAIAATGKIKWFNIWTSIIYISVLPISIVMFMKGAAPVIIFINLIIMVFALLFCSVYFANRTFDLSISGFLKDIVIRCLIVTALSVFAGFTVKNLMAESIYRFITIFTFSSILFILSTIIVGFTQKERLLVLSLIKSIHKSKFLRKWN